jgi:hypothetical protein
MEQDKAGIIDTPYKCRLCGHKVKANEYHIHDSITYQTQSDSANSGKYILSKKEQREQVRQRQLQRERLYINGQGQRDIVSREPYRKDKCISKIPDSTQASFNQKQKQQQQQQPSSEPAQPPPIPIPTKNKNDYPSLSMAPCFVCPIVDVCDEIF